MGTKRVKTLKKSTERTQAYLIYHYEEDLRGSEAIRFEDEEVLRKDSHFIY